MNQCCQCWISAFHIPSFVNANPLSLAAIALWIHALACTCAQGRYWSRGGMSRDEMGKEKNDGYDGSLACESISLSASNRASNWNPLESYEHQWNPLKSYGILWKSLKSLVFDANKTDIFPEKPTNVESIHGQTSLLRWALPLLSGLVVPHTWWNRDCRGYHWSDKWLLIDVDWLWNVDKCGLYLKPDWCLLCSLGVMN